jgi:hypothetical protein
MQGVTEVVGGRQSDGFAFTAASVCVEERDGGKEREGNCSLSVQYSFR